MKAFITIKRVIEVTDLHLLDESNSELGKLF